MVLVLGVDVHKGSHTAVAVDEVGRKVGEKTVRATDAGHRQMVRWARQLGPVDRWAVGGGGLSDHVGASGAGPAGGW